MSMNRLSTGEKIAGVSALLLLSFMFLRWYGLETAERPDLLFDLRLFEDDGNAWQTLEVMPVFLAAVILTVGAALRRLISRDWEPRVSPAAVVFVLGVLAGCLILVRIVFPPDVVGQGEGFTFETTREVGIFLALAAACGIAYGGRRAMQEEGASLSDLHPRAGPKGSSTPEIADNSRRVCS